MRPGRPIDWVIGFHHNRAAQIGWLRWIGGPAKSGESPIEEVTLSVSLESPLGPWRPLGKWQPQQDDELRLEEPVWVRFLRFS